VLVAVWTLAGAGSVLLIGLLPAFLGLTDRDWLAAVTKFSGGSTLPFALSALLFFSGYRRAGVAIAVLTLAGISALSALVLLR
jgi:hypothetical protein